MKKFNLVLSLFAFALGAQAQIPVNSYPYTQDFEGFDLLQNSSSCDATITGDSSAGWYQDPNDDGDWRADTAGTPSIGTGPGANLTSSGVGVGRDFNPGTTRGVYLYTEGTSATGCANATINLLSPLFDFSSDYYRVKFAWHMYGGGMGSLSLDVWDGSRWHLDFWRRTGTSDTNWHVATVNLGVFRGDTVQFRLRGVMGSTFATDMAIDDFRVEAYQAPRFDAILSQITREGNPYLLFPLSQSDSISFNARVYNDGIQRITGTEVRSIHSSYNGRVQLGNIDPARDIGGNLTPAFMPGAGDETIRFHVRINEQDSFPSNDSLTIASGLNDSVYAKEDGIASGGIGFNTGTGEVGQAFVIKNTDTLSSVTVYLNGPNNNDSIRVNLYQFNNGPGNLITSSEVVVVSNQPRWYTLQFPCDQVLQGGNRYFLSVQQMVANSNMGLGYSTNYHDSGMAFFGGGAAWTGLESANFFVNLLIRANFGMVRYPQIGISGADSLCEGESVTLEAQSPSQGSFSWSPANSLSSPFARRTTASPVQNTLYTVQITDQCGFSSSTSKAISVKSLPNAVISPDTLICRGDRALLRVRTSNPYQWINGPANSDWLVQGNTSGNYRVRIDSTNGCSAQGVVRVDISSPNAQISGDSALCEGVRAEYRASGGDRYDWNNGEAQGTSFQWLPRAGYSILLTAYDSLGCMDIATFSPQITPQPTYELSNDTLVCFGSYVNLRLESQADIDILWERGPDSGLYRVRGVFSRDYPVSFSKDGCIWNDTVKVEVEPIPDIQISRDTSICEGQTVILTVSSSAATKYEWSNQSTQQQISVSPELSTTYRARAISDNGCFNEDSVRVEIDPLPVARFDFNRSNRFFTFSNQSEHADRYRWDFGDGDTSDEREPAHTYAENGSYTITLTAYNGCGQDDSSFRVQLGDPANVTEAIAGNLRVWPNPVSDQLNIMLDTQQADEIDMKIVNASGQLMKSTKLSNKGLHHISLKGLSAGVYTLILNLNGDYQIRKILKY